MPRAKRIKYDEESGITYVGDNGRYYKGLFRQFRKEFPNLWTYGTNWEPHGYREIRIIIPGKGSLIYNEVGTSDGKITWEAPPKEDPKEIKKKEREMRPEMYQKFLEEIHWYQYCTGATQGDIAKYSGISREMINGYITGRRMPKVSTMRKIADTLGLDI